MTENYVRQVSDIMKRAVYKRDAILLIFIFPILCTIVGFFSILNFILTKVWG